MASKKPFVFICHSHEEVDKTFEESIEELKNKLSENNIESFVDHIDLEGGTEWRQEILDKLAIADVIIVIANKNMLTSTFCHLERGFAYSRGIKEIITCYYNDFETAKKLKSFKETQALNNVPFFGNGLKKLVKLITEEHAKKSCETKPEEPSIAPEDLYREIVGVRELMLKHTPNSENKQIDSEEKLPNYSEMKDLRERAERSFNDRNYSLAIELYEQFIKLCDEDSKEMLRVLQKLSSSYYHKNKHTLALNYEFKALEIFKKIYGENNENILYLYENIAITYEDMGDTKNAEKYYELAKKR
jgi:tetratricopeptide (TPR) repeat protein